MGYIIHGFWYQFAEENETNRGSLLFLSLISLSDVSIRLKWNTTSLTRPYRQNKGNDYFIFVRRESTILSMSLHIDKKLFFRQHFASVLIYFFCKYGLLLNIIITARHSKLSLSYFVSFGTHGHGFFKMFFF